MEPAQRGYNDNTFEAYVTFNGEHWPSLRDASVYKRGRVSFSVGQSLADCHRTRNGRVRRTYFPLITSMETKFKEAEKSWCSRIMSRPRLSALSDTIDCWSPSSNVASESLAVPSTKTVLCCPSCF